MTTLEWLYSIFASRYRWLSALATLLLCAALALGIGYVLSELGPLVAGVGVVGLFLGIWMLRDDARCLKWNRAMDWECYRVETDGADGIRFIDAYGNVSEGRLAPRDE